MVTVSTPTKPSSTRRSLRSSSAKSGSATPARKACTRIPQGKAQAARPSSGSRSAEETSGAETKIAEPATQKKATAEPGRVEEPESAPDNRTGTLVTTVDKYNDLTGRSVAAITAGIADLAGVDSAADTSFWSEVASTIPAAERKVRLLCVAALLAAQ